MKFEVTNEELKEIQEKLFWSDDDLERFKQFLTIYEEDLPYWTVDDIACAVAIFENAEQAFWFIEEEQDFGDLASMLATYDLTRLTEGQTTLAQHLVEEHEHYYKVKNGYVFFTE